MPPHHHLLQLTLQPGFSFRTLLPHNIKHPTLSHSSHYLILTQCFHLVSENGRVSTLQWHGSNKTATFWAGPTCPERRYRCFFGIPTSEITEKHMKWKSIFSQATNMEGNSRRMQLIKYILASKTTSHNFTITDHCWKWSRAEGCGCSLCSYEITMT